jgi:class 3 adenylate cyclase
VRRDAEHTLATVLFTDIVGSTELAAELGDRRWRVVLSRHQRLVRESLKRFRGVEVDTAGDGFFVVFWDQADAIRCACAISDAVREVGIEVRAGLNVGQVERIGKGFGGIAVHAGARVMSKATAGEVLVSGVLRDLVPGSGFAFADRGVQELRGIPGDVRLYAVVAVDGVPRPTPLAVEEARLRRGAIEPHPLIRRRRARLAAGACMVPALVIAAVWWFTAGGTSTRSAVVAPNSLVALDPANGEVVRSVRVPLGAYRARLAAGSGGVWALDSGDQTLVWLSEAGGQPRTLGVGDVGNDLAVGAGGVWIANVDNTVTQIDPKSYLVAGTVHLPDLPVLGIGGGGTSATGIAVGAGAVWVSQTRSLSLGLSRIRLDGEHARVVTSRAGGGPVTVAHGSVWLGEHVGTGGLPAAITRIDPSSGETTRIRLGIYGANGVALVNAYGSIWYLTGPGTGGTGTLWRLDPDGASIAGSVRVGSDPTGAAACGGAIWVALGSAGAILRIDPTTLRVTRRVRLGRTVTSIAAAKHVWVAVQTS